MADYMTSTEGQLDALGHAVNFNIGQSLTNSANAALGYIGPGAYEESPQSYTSTVADPGSTTTSYTDPYAAYGGKAAYDSLKSGFDTQHQQILGGATDAISNAGTSINSGILDLLQSLKTGQRNIDSQSAQNELSKKQGMRSILDNIGQGIRSGGVILAGKNAGDSSAAGALANAYGRIGRQQASQVGNQYAQGMNQVAMKQQDLGDQQALGVRHINENKTQVINGIVSDAQTKLAALDAAIAGASLPDRINIEQEKQNIRNQALASLQQYDQALQQGVGGIHAATHEQNISKAEELAQAGTAPDTMFNFSANAPAQFQNTGPFASALPLFTLNGKSKVQSA